jgi:general secretion pathway protein D
MKYVFFFLTVFSSSYLFGQTIEEKLANLREFEGVDENKSLYPAPKVNALLTQLRKELKVKYKEVANLVQNASNESDYQWLLEEVNLLRDEISEVEEKFRDEQSHEVMKENDTAGLFDADEVSISQFISEYGSQDYLYVIPPEIGSLKIQLHSSLMIPRESFPHLIEAILKANGIGYKEINPYTRQLFLMKQDLVHVNVITSNIKELEVLDNKTRCAFLYAPLAENVKNAFYFLERVRDPKSIFVYQVGSKIAIIGQQEDVKKMILMCENVWESKYPKVTKVISQSKLKSDDLIKVLKNYFGPLSDPSKSMISLKGGHDLSVMALAKDEGVILIGSKDIVERAECLIKETEMQINDPSELTVFWYTCSHTSPEDLAQILDQVYNSLIHSKIEGSQSSNSDYQDSLESLYPGDPNTVGSPEPTLNYNPEDSRYESQMYAKMKSTKDFGAENEKNKKSNFIPYPSTGSILMVVRKDTLAKIKEVIKKLDIPKRMCELEVLLCERMLNNSTRNGINLLKIGTNASQTKTGGISYDRADAPIVKGIFEFFFSRPSSRAFPAFDVTYNFLLSQEDVKVSACPSIITLNQVPASIAITDQISINNGASPVDTQSNKVFFQDSYERADFGITMTLTPTIHEPDIDDPEKAIYVTLDNNIAFENIKRDSQKDRPDVYKRTIKNQVRIKDGQTIILGGLRSKLAEDKNEKIPFLGEIPGFGKLFGTNVLNEKSNEMFIFIKPRVIHDPKHDLIKIREDRLKKRPGDIEAILCEIRQARQKKEAKLFQKSFNLFFGDPDDATTKF